MAYQLMHYNTNLDTFAAHALNAQIIALGRIPQSTIEREELALRCYSMAAQMMQTRQRYVREV